MAIQKAKKNEKKKVEYKPIEIEVSRVKEIANRDDCYRFTLTINGVDINGCQYITYTTKEGEEGNFISLPAYKGSDNKYYNHAYFPINDPAYAKEFAQIENMISEQLKT